MTREIPRKSAYFPGETGLAGAVGLLYTSAGIARDQDKNSHLAQPHVRTAIGDPRVSNASRRSKFERRQRTMQVIDASSLFDNSCSHALVRTVRFLVPAVLLLVGVATAAAND